MKSAKELLDEMGLSGKGTEAAKQAFLRYLSKTQWPKGVCFDSVAALRTNSEAGAKTDSFGVSGSGAKNDKRPEGKVAADLAAVPSDLSLKRSCPGPLKEREPDSGLDAYGFQVSVPEQLALFEVEPSTKPRRKIESFGLDGLGRKTKSLWDKKAS